MAKVRQSRLDVTRAETEELHRQSENEPVADLPRPSMEERFHRLALHIEWGKRVGWGSPPRTVEYYRNDPWVRLRKLYLERQGIK